MRFLNFGSINIDNVYAVDHFVREGETLSSGRLEHFIGGKGLNQSIALARAGAVVFHAGCVGTDGIALVRELEKEGIDVSCIVIDDSVPTGHAVIQVDRGGDNCILLFKGANGKIEEDMIDNVLSRFGAGDWLLLQNEISGLPRIIDRAARQKMTLVLNPSPISGDLLRMPELSLIDWFILNEVEGEAMTGESAAEKILDRIGELYPRASTVLTLGSRGSVCRTKDGEWHQKIIPVDVVDTTAAGDTFTGYFFASLTSGASPAQALLTATRASSAAVSVKGASNSIPRLEDLK